MVFDSLVHVLFHLIADVLVLVSSAKYFVNLAIVAVELFLIGGGSSWPDRLTTLSSLSSSPIIFI